METEIRTHPVIAFRGLSKHFGGERALDSVDFRVFPCEVHGLLGQNGSGKTTLIKILAGLYQPDPGAEFWVNGRVVDLPLVPGQFRRLGISFVHQNLALVPSLTGYENLFVGSLSSNERWYISKAQEIRRARELFERFGVDIDPRQLVEELTPVQRAQLAIVRAMGELEQSYSGDYRGCLLVLDEPTPFLPRHDVDKLFALVREVVAKGASVIFVSHDVDEVMEITDRATVLRDGRVAATLVTREATKDQFVEAIVGRSLPTLTAGVSSYSREDQQPLIELRGLSGERCWNVSLSLHQGEAVGLTGLAGSGFDEVLYLIYGAKPASAGSLWLNGRELNLAKMSPRRAVREHIVLIPADRPGAGVVLDLSVLDNLTLPLLESVQRGWVINWLELKQKAAAQVQRYKVKPPDLEVELGFLSGGNQQKVVLAKWFQTQPRLILLDEPTQGVDIGARQEVFGAIREATRQGAAVLCASTDYEQLAALCSRVLVFSNGQVVSELSSEEVSKESIAEHCYRSLELARLRR